MRINLKSFSQGDDTPVINFKPSFKLRFARKRFVLFCAKRYVSRISVFLIGLTLSSAIYAEGDLQTIRDDVRGLTPNTPQPASAPATAAAQPNSSVTEEQYNQQDHPNGQPSVSDYEAYCFPYCIIGAGYLAIAPYSVPRMCLRDDSSVKAHFPDIRINWIPVI